MRADNARGRNFFRRVAAKRTMSAALQPKAVRQTICLANFINWGIDMKKTDNYSLPQWEKQDFIKMEDFNDLTRKTDAALKAHDTALGEKAAATALAAEAENRSAALAALQASLAAAIGSGGKTCRIFTGSYTGTGSSSVSIPTPFYPVLAFVQSAGMATALCLFRHGAEQQRLRCGCWQIADRHMGRAPALVGLLLRRHHEQHLCGQQQKRGIPLCDRRFRQRRRLKRTKKEDPRGGLLFLR